MMVFIVPIFAINTIDTIVTIGVISNKKQINLIKQLKKNGKRAFPRDWTNQVGGSRVKEPYGIPLL